MKESPPEGAGVAALCGVHIDLMTEGEALAALEKAARCRAPLGVHFVNAYTLSLAVAGEGFAQLLRDADLVLPDGQPVVWAVRLAGARSVQQVCGPDFMLHAFERGTGLHHYLYGAAPRTLRLLEQSLRRRFPAAEIAGAESPPFRPLSSDEESAAAEHIHASGANVVWVGLGTPKQDVFVERMKTRVGLPMLAVGAAFDFHAGTKSRPPPWVSRAGLEWAYRWASEPRRLSKRYIVGNARFLLGLLRDGVTVRHPSGSPVGDDP